jgi:hypothetical protein
MYALTTLLFTVVCALLATTSLSLISVVWNRVDKIWKRVQKIKTEPTSTITNHNLKTHKQEMKTHLIQALFSSITSAEIPDDIQKLKLLSISLDEAFQNDHLGHMFANAIDYTRCARIVKHYISLLDNEQKKKGAANFVNDSLKAIFVEPSQISSNQVLKVQVFNLIEFLLQNTELTTVQLTTISNESEYDFTQVEKTTMLAFTKATN